jgi:hypothetical protein
LHRFRLPPDFHGTDPAARTYREVILVWTFPSSAAIPIGIALAGLSLLEAIAVTIIVLSGGVVFVLARLASTGRYLRFVYCPGDGTRARTLVTRASGDSSARVLRCSRWTAGNASCDQRCLPRAA